MLKLVLFAFAAVAQSAMAQSAVAQSAVAQSAIAQSTATPAAPESTAAPASPPAATTTPVSAEAIASDPRMLAAIRHANAVADKRCGAGVGGVVDIAARAEAQRCRRRIVTTAKLDAEGEITGR